MAIVAITDEQRLSLRNNARFKSLARIAVMNYALELIVLTGTSGNLDSLTPVDWAKRRFLAKGIILHPNSQDWETWYDQFMITLKDAVVWDNALNTEDAAITAILAIASTTAGSFRATARAVFGVRAEPTEF